jgi:large subunit ribosomal protein L13
MPQIQRKKISIDATGKAPGRLATEIARLLMGKHKADFAKNVDAGDTIEVENAGAMVLTGKKMEQRVYYAHTGHPRGLSATTIKSVWAKDAADVLRRAVSRMLPKNSHRDSRMKRLTFKK